MRSALPCLLAVALSACGLHVRGWGTIGGAKIDATTAANPLEGRALTVEVTGSPDIEVLDASNCSLWPILDEYQVSADSSRVCVAAEIFLLSYESGPLPIDTLNVGIATDGRPPTMIELASAGQMRKIGRCYGSDRQRTGVWSFQFSGCTQNNGLVTHETQSLTLRRRKGLFSGAEGTELARWTFLQSAQAQQAQRPAPAAAPSPSTSARAHYERGTSFLREQRYPEALDAFSKCLTADPQLSQGYVARGNSLLGLQRYAEAATDYEYALSIDAKSALPLYGMGDANRGMRDVKKARVYYQRFIDSTLSDATPSLKQEVARKLAALK